MSPKDRLIALAVAFGIITEGLTVVQLQEALDANAGYQAFVAKEKELAKAQSDKDTAEAKVLQLEADLKKANEEKASLTEELDQANETISDMAAQAAAPASVDEADKVFYTDTAGDSHEIVHPTFRFRGKEYQSAEAVEKHRDVLQELLEAKAFIFKQA
jgi:hypothetical protein